MKFWIFGHVFKNIFIFYFFEKLKNGDFFGCFFGVFWGGCLFLSQKWGFSSTKCAGSGQKREKVGKICQKFGKMATKKHKNHKSEGVLGKKKVDTCAYGRALFGKNWTLKATG